MTQSLGLNYGGIIQNYALQKVLLNMGHCPITIDRAEDNPHSKLKIIASRYKSLFYRYVLKHKVCTYLDYRRISFNNRTFIRNNIKLSPKIQSTSALSFYFNRSRFYAVVVGSDQVWRPQYSFNIYNFFLDFLHQQKKIKKVAYAASFGTDKWSFSDRETRLCGELLKQFDGISVRENSGVSLCLDYFNINNVVHVLDPTLLLNAEDYSKLIGKTTKSIGLFTYVLDDSKSKHDFIKLCATTLNLSLHKNQAKLSPVDLELDNLADYIIPPIEGWLQGFRDAEFIITDSFHGMVFSIINSKPFFVLVNKDRGAARFESLLTQLGLEDRLIYDVEGFDFSSIEIAIDYNEVHQKLNLLKKESLQFLRKYL